MISPKKTPLVTSIDNWQACWVQSEREENDAWRHSNLLFDLHHEFQNKEILHVLN
jgi:hypothetical protein